MRQCDSTVYLTFISRVHLLLHVRKFRCETAECPRQIFTERLAPFLEPWARMTTRFSQTIEAVGLATSGELGARFSTHLGIATSPTTILRRTMALPAHPPEHVSLLGIEDWSFRRGRKFGTILVDLAPMKSSICSLIEEQKRLQPGCRRIIQ